MKLSAHIPGKRWLFIGHRWMGIVLCLFFLLWFVSGVVMMYVGYPKLTPAERMAHLPPLAASGVLLTPDAALSASGVSGAREIRLAVDAAGRPAYRITQKKLHGKTAEAPIVIFADDGSRLASINEATAKKAAETYCRMEQPGCSAAYLGQVDEDGYTHSKALDPYRPLHLFAIDGGAVWLYVSSRTGEVVRDATQAERFWNWTGAWLHWLYPFRGGLLDAWWHDIVVWSSTIGTVLAITGILIGILRWRFRRRYASGHRTPYREGWMRWHHLTGLVFGTLAATWVFSGLMSMNPWSVFGRSPPRPTLEAYAGGPWHASELRLPDGLLAGGDVRELVWTGGAGRHLLQVHRKAGTELRDPAGGLPVVLTPGTISKAVRALLPAAPTPGLQVLERYDTYYYGRVPHTMTGHVEKPLPIWRYVFNDAAGTWFHVDPSTGAVISELDRTGRVRRWLFSFLHSFDWMPLLERRPVWDILLIVLSLGGISISITGIRIGWRRLIRAN